MNKIMGMFSTLLLCTVAWTHAADSFEVNLSANVNSSLGFYDKGECEFEKSSAFFTENKGKCPQGAVIKIEAGEILGYQLKCWKNSDVCVSTNPILELKVSSDTTLSAYYEKKDIDLSISLSEYSGSFQNPVFGKDNFKLMASLSFNKQSESYFVYQYNSGNGYKNMMDPVKISKDKGLPEELSTISFSRDFETEIKANGNVWKHSFRKDSTVHFRVAAAFKEESLINHTTDVEYSKSLAIYWKHPVVFESVSGIKIRSTNANYGEEVYITSDKDIIEVPADDDKYLYDYRWHRDGASGQEYLYSNVAKIIMTDSIHYKAELIKLPKEQLEIAFTVTDFELGKSAKDIKIKTPNNCFTSSVKSITLEGNEISGAIKESGNYGLYLNVAIADTGACANDNLVNTAKVLAFRSSLKNAISLNGVRANGEGNVYYDGDEKEGQIIYSKTIKDLRHVVYETITGEIALDTNIARGEKISNIHIIDWQKLGVPVSTVNTEYKFRFHRIGDSGDEYVESDADIIVGDSVHYRAEMTDTLYLVHFYDDEYFGGKEIKSSWGSIRTPINPPKVPNHKGFIFDEWNGGDISKVTKPMWLYASYKPDPALKLSFKVTGYDFGKKIDDIKIEAPNKYFSVSKKLLNKNNEDIDIIDSNDICDMYHINLNISVADVDDSLVNVWKYIHKKHNFDLAKPHIFINDINVYWSTIFEEQSIKIIYTLYKVEFFDINGTVLKQEMVGRGLSATAPKDPSRKGLVFKGWNVPFDSISIPTTSWAEYEVKKIPEYAYTVTGFESGKPTKDIKIKAPNNCFSSSVKNLTLDGKNFDGTITKSGTYELLINVAISDTGSCDNDSLVNVTRILNSNQGLKNAFTVNGDSALYKGIGGSRGELTYSKKITVAESSSSKVTSSSSQAKSSSSVKTTSSSSQAKSSSSGKVTSSSSKAKSSSSGKATSSSSKAKSSSSSKNKDALPALAQKPQFALTAIGRDIQITGARIGSAYDVFDMQGHVIIKGRTNTASFNLTMNHAGMYLVKIGDQAQKVQVK